MNKKIIALAVAAGFAAAPLAAQADMTVYGQAQVEVGSWGGDGADGQSVQDNARGRIGFKASEDLGGGLKSIAKFEFKTDTADGDSATTGNNTGVALTKREAMVGLKGGWGEFQAGRLKSAYKYMGGVKYDAFTATILEARGNGGMSGGTYGHNGFISDSVAYKGKFGGFSLWATYDLDNGGGAGVTNADGSHAMTLGGKFGTKMWEAGLAYVTDDGNSAAGPKVSAAEHKATKVFGSVTLGGAHTIRGQYEMINLANTDNDAKNYYLNYDFKFGKNMVDVGYGDYSVDNTSSADTTFMRVALKHKFSKKTSTWVGYRSSDYNGSANDVTVISVGLRKDF